MENIFALLFLASGISCDPTQEAHGYRGIVVSATADSATFNIYMRDGEFWKGQVTYFAGADTEVYRNGEEVELNEVRPGDDTLFHTRGLFFLEVYAYGEP